MNMVEIRFSILTNQQVRGAYHDVPELINAIKRFITGYNERAQPFVWTKTAEQIIAKAINNNPLPKRCTSVSAGSQDPLSSWPDRATAT
jgi:hypothetical protein